jgi:hypothetical protein
VRLEKYRNISIIDVMSITIKEGRILLNIVSFEALSHLNSR